MRALTAAAIAAKDARTYSPEWLLWARGVGLAISVTTRTLPTSEVFDWEQVFPDPIGEDFTWGFEDLTPRTVVWEQRFADIGEVRTEAPTLGGLGSVSSLRVRLVNDGAGMSAPALWNVWQRMEGQPVELSLLFPGAGFADRIPLFTGVIDQVPWTEGESELLAVEQSLGRNVQLPQTLLTASAYPQAPAELLNRPLPLFYGRGSATRLPLVPLLLIDGTTFLTYLIAGHPCAPVGTRVGVWPPQARDASLEFAATAGEVNPTGTQVTLTRPIVAQLFQSAGLTTEVGRSAHVTGAGQALDGDVSTLAILHTNAGQDADGNGQAFLGIRSGEAVPTGVNVVKLTLSNFRRSAASAATVVGTLSLNLLAADGVTVVSENLWVQDNLRRRTSPQTKTFTITPITVDATYRLEAFLEVLNEGTLGTADDTFELGEVELRLGYQPTSALETLYLTAAEGDNIGGRYDPTGHITGVAAGSRIENPADVLRSVCVDEGRLTIGSASFVAQRTALAAYRFDGGLGAGWSAEQQGLRETLREMAEQAVCVLFPGGDGQYQLVTAVGPGTRVHTLDASNILLENPESPADQARSSFHIEHTPIELVAHTFRLHYGWHPGMQRYTRLAEATPAGSTHATRSAELQAYCLDALLRYGPRPPWEYEARWIADADTADRLLRRTVETFWSQHCVVSLETTLAALHVEVADWVQITYPTLPALVNGGLFRVDQVEIRPQRGTIWLRCHAVVVPQIHYQRLNWQDGATHSYWYVDIPSASSTGVSATPPSLVTRQAVPLGLSPVPAWVRVTDRTGVPWYILPNPAAGGAPMAQATVPAVGPGVIGSPRWLGPFGGYYQLMSTTAGEVIMEPEGTIV